jgi:hypothetical protein
LRTINQAPCFETGRIDNDDRTGSQFTLDQKIGNFRERRECRVFHVHDLLALRRKDNVVPPRLLDFRVQRTELKTFARASSAPEQ